MIDQDPKLWKTPKLITFLKKASLAYRQGSPLIDDDTYDHIYLAELQRREPEHPFLNKAEVEPDFGSRRLKHPVPMLSTENPTQWTRPESGLPESSKKQTNKILMRLTSG